MMIIFEIANNHDGDIDKAIRMVDEFDAVAKQFPQFEYAFKTQYRSDEYFHPDCDPEHPYVKRFKQAQMKDEEWTKLVFHIKNLGHETICTPFDEKSVRKAREHGYDIIKVGSPSITDIPLLEEIGYGVPYYDPIIISVGGATKEEIDKALFIIGHNEVTIMHCWSQYPTDPLDDMTSQIGWLKKTYPGHKIGYSCHQDPSKKMSVPNYVDVLEFHICLLPKPNSYSFWPEQMDRFLTEMVRQDEERITGPRPEQFMRKAYEGKWYWKP